MEKQVRKQAFDDLIKRSFIHPLDSLRCLAMENWADCLNSGQISRARSCAQQAGRMSEASEAEAVRLMSEASGEL